MPEISRFFGIVIRMFMEVEQRHSTPHFHAYYQGSVAVFGIETIDLLAGELPRRDGQSLLALLVLQMFRGQMLRRLKIIWSMESLLMAWAELHQKELMSDWTALQNGCLPVAIQPLQ